MNAVLSSILFLALLSTPVYADKQDAKSVDKAFELGRKYQSEQESLPLYKKPFDNDKQTEIKKEYNKIKQDEKDKKHN